MTDLTRQSSVSSISSIGGEASRVRTVNFSRPTIVPNQVATPQRASVQNFETSPPRKEEGIPKKDSFISELRLFLFSFFVSMNTKGLNLAFGAFLFGYKDVQVKSSENYYSMASIGSVYAAVLLGLFPVLKWLFDRLSPKDRSKKRLYDLVLGGICICIRTAVLAAAGSVSSFEWLVIMHGCIVGLMDSVLYSLAVIYLYGNFEIRPLKWVSFIRIGASIGGLLYTTILKACMSSIGFQWGIRIIAIMGGATMLPAMFFLPSLARDYKHPKSDSSLKLLIFRHILMEDRDGKKSKGPSYTLTVFGMLCIFTGLYYGFHFIVLYGVHEAHKTPQAAMTLLMEMCACHSLGTIIASLLKGILQDQMSVLTFAILCTSQMMYTWIGADDNTGLVLFSCFYGFYAAAVETLHLTCMLTYIISFNNENDWERVRYRTMFFFVAMGVGAMAGGPLTGFMIEMSRDLMFWVADMLTGTMLFLGSLSFFLALLLMNRRREAGMAQARRVDRWA